ncbi:MAG: hypothetical protein AB1414_15140 [bacterium]
MWNLDAFALLKPNIHIGNSIEKLEEKNIEDKIKVITKENKMVITIYIPHMIEITDEDSKEVEIIRLLELRNLSGRKLFTQAEVGRLFELSRQMINRRGVALTGME